MPAPSSPNVRAASLRGLERLAREFKVDEMALMLEVGLCQRKVADPEAWVDLAAGCKLLELFAQRSGREDIGLLLAQERRISNLGALGLVTALQADLRHALQVLVARRQEVISGLVVVLEEHQGIAVLRLDYVVPGAPYPRQATENTVGVLVGVMRQFLGRNWTPRRVCFKHPPPADLSTHRKVLGWAVEFEHDFNAIVLTSQDLDSSAPLHDPGLAKLAYDRLPLAATQSSIAQTCREHLAILIPQGRMSIDHVATRLGLQRRTLQRWLEQEGLTFSELVLESRKELLQSYLAMGHMSLADIAQRLGFSAPSAFSRWHRATFGGAARLRKKPVDDRSGSHAKKSV